MKTLMIISLILLSSCSELMYVGSSAGTPCDPENNPKYEDYAVECEQWKKAYPREYAAYEARVAYKKSRGRYP
jgi:hypothetical protein